MSVDVGLGNALKVVARRSERAKVRAMFEALGVREVRAPRSDVDVFVLRDGAQVGFFFRDDALADESMERSVWIELAVVDLTAASAALERVGVERVPYDEVRHSYYRAPGGLVFRLVAKGLP